MPYRSSVSRYRLSSPGVGGHQPHRGQLRLGAAGGSRTRSNRWVPTVMQNVPPNSWISSATACTFHRVGMTDAPYSRGHVHLEQRPTRVPVRTERHVHIIGGIPGRLGKVPGRVDQRLLVVHHALGNAGGPAGGQDQARTAWVPGSLVDAGTGITQRFQGRVLAAAAAVSTLDDERIGTHAVAQLLRRSRPGFLRQQRLWTMTTRAWTRSAMVSTRSGDTRLDSGATATPAMDAATASTMPCQELSWTARTNSPPGATPPRSTRCPARRRALAHRSA